MMITLLQSQMKSDICNMPHLYFVCYHFIFTHLGHIVCCEMDQEGLLLSSDTWVLLRRRVWFDELGGGGRKRRRGKPNWVRGDDQDDPGRSGIRGDDQDKEEEEDEFQVVQSHLPR